jgi:5-dehydro-2-deoxygluconokinase
MLDATILGRIGYDLIADQPGVPLSEVRSFTRYLGGSSANMAVGLSRLGLKCGIVSALGTEGISDYLCGFLAKEGVDVAHVHRVEGLLPSLALTELHPPDRFPQVYYRQDPADAHLAVTDDDLNYIGRSRMFITNGTALCASPSRESAYRALERARNAGCRTVFDIDYRWMSWKSPEEAGLAAKLALPYVDVLVGNETEFKLAAGTNDLNAAADILRDSGVQIVLSKMSEHGVRAFDRNEEYFAPPFEVEVASTIGAGDGFASGFLYALHMGKPVDVCLRYGNAAAAIVVSRLSCSEAMPTLAEVEDLIRRQPR